MTFKDWVLKLQAKAMKRIEEEKELAEIKRKAYLKEKKKVVAEEGKKKAREPKKTNNLF